MIDQDESGILLPIPLGEDRVFRNQSMDDILELLYRNPHSEFGVRQLREITEHGAKTVDTAITLFTQLGVITTRRDGNKKLVSINRDRVQKPDDPILEISQEEFRDPVKTFLDEVDQAEAEIVGIILFGSVARGEADRASDIDLQVIISGELTEARRELHDIRQEVEGQKFDGERYELQLLVESVESAESYGEKLREIFSEGIKLRETNELETVGEAVFNG
jgi:predicted nucleotidyltransferase